MSNPTQSDVLNRMIARLEEANARSYLKPPRSDEPSATSGHDDRRELQSQTPLSKPRSSRGRLWFIAVLLPVLAASVYAATSASELSYAHAVMSRIARWPLQTGAEIPPQAAPAPQMSREIEPQLQKMTGELADLQQQIAQLRASQDLVHRSDAEAAAQYKIDREQMMRDNANVVDRLNVTQDQLREAQAQLAAIVASQFTNPGRKPFRRKRVSALSQRARARSLAR